MRSHVIYCSRLRGSSRWVATPKVAETIPTASLRPPWASEGAIRALKTLRTAKLLSTGKDRVRRRKTAVGLKDEFAIAGLGWLGINDLRVVIEHQEWETPCPTRGVGTSRSQSLASVADTVSSLPSRTTSRFTDFPTGSPLTCPTKDNAEVVATPSMLMMWSPTCRPAL